MEDGLLTSVQYQARIVALNPSWQSQTAGQTAECRIKKKPPFYQWYTCNKSARQPVPAPTKLSARNPHTDQFHWCRTVPCITVLFARQPIIIPSSKFQPIRTAHGETVKTRRCGKCKPQLSTLERPAELLFDRVTRRTV